MNYDIRSDPTLDQKSYAFLNLIGQTPLTFTGMNITLSGGLTAASITDTGLTSGRVPFAGTGGLLGDASTLTFSGGVMSIGPMTNGTYFSLLTASAAGAGSGTGGYGIYDNAGALLALFRRAGGSGESLQLIATNAAESQMIIGAQTAGALGSGILFQTDASKSQFQILHTAGATRYATITGSNGGNPTINVTAGNLAITPAVVLGSTIQPAASGYLSSDGTVGLTQASTVTLGKSITLKDGLVVAFA